MQTITASIRFVFMNSTITTNAMKLTPLLQGILMLFSSCLLAQTTQTEFGKNRIQYHQNHDEWSLYESPNFITYWYGEGRNIGQAVVQLAEYDCQAVQNLLEYKYNDKIEVIVYTDLTDLKQSNIGAEKAFENSLGQTKIVGNKMFVYFDGDHNHLRKQIREGIASIYLNAMLFGANLQEVVQNAVMLHLPTWFKDGLISYIGETWSVALDNEMRNVIQQNKYTDFTTFAREQPKLAGHALWYYIHELFGEKNVSNLLYLVRINRSIESGLVYVLGNSMAQLEEAWLKYYTDRYKTASTENLSSNSADALTIKNRRKLPLQQLKISPDGKYIAYATNEIGRFKVYIQDAATGTRKRIMKSGYRNMFQATDYGYPLLAWSPNAQELLVLYEKRDIIKSMRYEVATEKKTMDVLPTQFQRIYSIDFATNNDVLMTAAVRGFSDVFMYQLNTRQSQRITNDTYDDLDAVYTKIGNANGVLFASNRPDSSMQKVSLDTILPIGNFDIYYYDLDSKPEALVRVTRTPLYNERQPLSIDSTYFAYLSDETGIINRKVAYLADTILYYTNTFFFKDGTKVTLHQDSLFANLDSTKIDTIIQKPVTIKNTIAHFNTDYPYNIAMHHVAPIKGKWLEQRGQQVYPSKVYLPTIDTLTAFSPTPSSYRQLVQQKKEKQPSAEKQKTTVSPKATQPVKPATETPKNDYLFQSEFDDDPTPLKPAAPVVATPKDTMPTVDATENIANVVAVPVQKKNAISPTPKHLFRQSRIIPYRLKFRTDHVTTNFDNSLLFSGLDSYAGLNSQQGFSYPPPGILVKANFKDLLEDYEVECGMRIPVTFNGVQYFMYYNDKKKHMDKRYGLYYATERTNDKTNVSPPQKSQVSTVIGVYELRYPLDIFTSLRGSATFRNGRFVKLATEAQSLAEPTISQQRAGLKLEYIFDNTLDVALNIKNGTQYKVFAEVLKRFDVNFNDKVSANFRKGFMTILGIDARHYQRLDNRSILAFRLAGCTSFGSEKILYFLGGTNNWLLPKFNNEINVPADSTFAYTGLAADLRGFYNNIRNGNSYLLANTELRVPIFRYLIKRPLQSAFLRNLQLIGFFDVGTAWHGSSPFAKENPLNTTVITQPTVTVRVNYFRDPIIAGYGFGVRSSLFGYFFRFDYGWGIETKVVQKPVWHLSLGFDF